MYGGMAYSSFSSDKLPFDGWREVYVILMQRVGLIEELYTQPYRREKYLMPLDQSFLIIYVINVIVIAAELFWEWTKSPKCKKTK